MFNKQLKEEDQGRQLTKGTTIIAAGTVFKGDIDCTNDLRIDGEVCGNIKSGSKIVIGAQGKVEGNIVGVNADVMGIIEGNILTSESLSLRGQAIILGDIATRSLTMEPSVNFNGKCRMGGDLSESKPKGETLINKEPARLAIAK